jgi:hypothetical protein
MCRNPKNAELWLKSVRIEAEAGLEDIAKVRTPRLL